MALSKTIFIIPVAAVLTLSLGSGPGRLDGANAQSIIRSDSETEAYRQGFEDGQRAALERGDRIAPEEYHRLDGDLFRERYGRELDPDYGYVETDEGTRLLLELATGIIAEVLGEQSYDARPPERREGRRAGIDIPPGHYPPPGSCRVWFPDRPPGQQPPPGECNVRVPRGAILVEG